MTETTMNDLLVRIATDPELVKEIQANPGLLTTRFGLSPDEAARVAAMRIDNRSAPPRRLEERLSRSGGAFGSVVAVAAQAAGEHDTGGEPMDYGADEEPLQLATYEAPEPETSEPDSTGPESPEPSMESESEAEPKEAEMASPTPAPDPPEMAAPSASPGAAPELDETEPGAPEMETEPEPPTPSTVDPGVVHARVDVALSGALESRGITLPPEVQANLSRAITDVLVGLQTTESEPTTTRSRSRGSADRTPARHPPAAADRARSPG